MVLPYCVTLYSSRLECISVATKTEVEKMKTTAERITDETNKPEIKLICAYHNVEGKALWPVGHDKTDTQQDTPEAKPSKLSKLTKKLFRSPTASTANKNHSYHSFVMAIDYYAKVFAKRLARTIAAIIICGIAINIAAEFWPELKTEIPGIYGFFNGLLMIVEKGFEYTGEFLKKAFENLSSYFG